MRRHADNKYFSQKRFAPLCMRFAYGPAMIINDEYGSLRKHAYSNILKILPPKNESFQIKSSDIFHTSAQNIDCGYSLEPPRRDGSNEYPQFMFRAEIRKIRYTPVNPSFTA